MVRKLWKPLRTSLLLVPLLLTACDEPGAGSKQVIKYDLAPVPQSIRACFTKLTGMPEKGSMTEKQAVGLITRLHSSEVKESLCGRRLLALYDSQNVRLIIRK